MALDFDGLKEFIVHGMKMQHIYQPLMIKTLLESPQNRLPVRKVAEQFLQKDESQIEYYIKITKEMPGRILRKHGIVTYDSGNFTLNTRSVSPQQRAELIALCESKIDEYEEKRGKLIWLHRAKAPSYVPGSLRYNVLTKAKGRCELCGIPAEVKALDVDHIVPRNRGGETVMENLQALCYTCNSQKRDFDDTDFRSWNSMYSDRDDECVFCNMDPSRIKALNNLAFSFEYKYPVTAGHMLVSPNRHTRSFFDMGAAEQKACFIQVEQAKEQIMESDPTVTSFNIGVNDGKDAG